MGQDVVVAVPEKHTLESDAAGASLFFGDGVLTGAHGEEEGADEEVGGVSVGVVDGTGMRGAMGEEVKVAEEAGCDCFLAVWRRVEVVVGRQERSDDGEEFVIEVKGA